MKRLYLFLSVLTFACLAKAENPQKPFTHMEVNHLKVHTPGLFDGRSSFSVRLDSIGEQDFCFPLPGGKLISGYGTRGGRHSGYDIKTKANDTIRCVFDGVVRLSKPYAAYGNLIVVRHANGLESVYSHQSKNLVHSGDTVKVGQPLGLTGRTGRATTEHLHFEIRVNGQHVNPGLVLDMEGRSLRRRELIVTKTANGVSVKPKNEK